MTAVHRAGFVAFVGRPNAGKSTLTNALVGEKVVITSSKPQTTRHAVRGIVHRAEAQLVLLDTPGLHRPRTLLGERLNEEVRTAWSQVDVVGFCLPADEKIGPGDRFIARELAELSRTQKVAVVTKTDLVARDRVAEALMAVAELGRGGRSRLGRGGAGVGRRPATRSTCSPTCCRRCCPRAPPLYPDGELTDEPEATLVAELIREAALEGVRDELPHSIAVVVEEMLPREDRHADRPLLDVHAYLYVERHSQKAHRDRPKGARLKDSAPGARGRSRRCSARRSTSTCTSRSPRTGSATPGSCASSASDGHVGSLGGSAGTDRAWWPQRGSAASAAVGRGMCRVAIRELGGSIAIVAEARAFVAATLRRWDLEALVVDAELLTSELVTNAVVHARSDVTVSLAVADGTAEIGVTDASPEPRLRGRPWPARKAVGGSGSSTGWLRTGGSPTSRPASRCGAGWVSGRTGRTARPASAAVTAPTGSASSPAGGRSRRPGRGRTPADRRPTQSTSSYSAHCRTTSKPMSRLT